MPQPLSAGPTSVPEHSRALGGEPVAARHSASPHLRQACGCWARSLAFCRGGFWKRGRSRHSVTCRFLTCSVIAGEEAKAIAPRYPQTVFEGARDALAAPYSDELTARYADRFHFYNVTRDETRGTALFNADGDQSFSAEELMASMLHYVLEFTKGHAKAEVRDAVLTVPPYYGQEHRTALLDAAEIAGMNVLALLNEHSAAALQYGVDKKVRVRGEARPETCAPYGVLSRVT